MTTQTDAVVSKLASISQTLNKASDLLTAELGDFEKSLNTFALGVSAWVTLSVPEADDLERESIGYDKHDGKWCLLWARYKVNDPDGTWQQKPLLESPRDVRSNSGLKLPELLETLMVEAEKRAKKTVEMAGQVHIIADSLKMQ